MGLGPNIRQEITLEAFLDDQSGGSLFLAPLANSLQVLGGEDLALLVTRGSRQASIGENGPFRQGLLFLFAFFVPISSPLTPLERTTCFSSPGDSGPEEFSDFMNTSV